MLVTLQKTLVFTYKYLWSIFVFLLLTLMFHRCSTITFNYFVLFPTARTPFICRLPTWKFSKWNGKLLYTETVTVNIR